MYLWIAFFLCAALLGVCVWWRLACRGRSLPWPYWLAFMLENPYMRVVSPSGVLCGRLRLKKGMKVLDIGSGAGRVSRPIAQAVGPRGVVFALDMQEKMHQKLVRRMGRYRLQNYQTILADLNAKKPLASSLCDRALMVTVLGEVMEPLELLQRVRRNLTPDGLLSITEVIPDPCYMTSRRVLSLCQQAGFTLEESFKAPLAYTLNFRPAAKKPL